MTGLAFSVFPFTSPTDLAEADIAHRTAQAIHRATINGDPLPAGAEQYSTNYNAWRQAGGKIMATKTTTPRAPRQDRPEGKHVLSLRSPKHGVLLTKVIGKVDGAAVRNETYLVVDGPAPAQEAADLLIGATVGAPIYDARLYVASYVDLRHEFPALKTSRVTKTTNAIDALIASKAVWSTNVNLDGTLNWVANDKVMKVADIVATFGGSEQPKPGQATSPAKARAAVKAPAKKAPAKKAAAKRPSAATGKALGKAMDSAVAAAKATAAKKAGRPTPKDVTPNLKADKPAGRTRPPVAKAS